MQLNQGQEAAAHAVFQFLMSDDKEFSLSGPAGTGKTTLLKHILGTILQEYQDACKLLGIKPVDYEAVLTATTNKATEVLQASTGFPAQTIHSFMNLKVYDDYKTGESKISKKRAFIVHSRKVIFIDEASMVDTTLLKYLHEGTDKTCKIIYIGDHCQMAPVFETISPVYKNPKNFAELTQPMRNAGQPALVNLCKQMRHTVETLEFKPILPVPGVIDYLSEEEAQAYIDQAYQVDEVNERILAYTNAQVKEYNTYIRDLRGRPEQLSKGEILINNTVVPIPGSARMMRVEEEFVIVNEPSSPMDIVVDEKEETVISVYQIELASPRNLSLTFKVYQPVHPEYLAQLRQYYNAHKNWKMFYQLRDQFPDLRPKDAATVYKAQGSTYRSVFIDLENIGKCRQPEQAARMLYVAVSRPTDRILFRGTLPPKYGGAP